MEFMCNTNRDFSKDSFDAPYDENVQKTVNEILKWCSQMYTAKTSYDVKTLHKWAMDAYEAAPPLTYILDESLFEMIRATTEVNRIRIVHGFHVKH